MSINDGEAGSDAALFDEIVGGQDAALAPAPAAPAAPEPLAPADAKVPDGGQPRAPDGKFAPKDAPAAPAAPAVPAADGKPAAPAGEQKPDAETAATAPVVAPPSGWSPVAKSKWDQLDPDVRAAVAKREDEISAGFKRYEGMARWADQAESKGRTLAQEAERYTAAEAALEKDLVGSLFWLGGNQGITPAQLIQLMIDRTQGGAAPRQGGPQPAGQPQQPQDVQAVVDAAFARREEREAMASIKSDLDRFIADPAHRYYENVKGAMAALLQSNQASDLQDAYEKACWADPQIRPFMSSAAPTTQGATPPGPATKGRALSPEAKRASGSLSGSPLPSGKSSSTTAAAESELYDQLVAGRA